MIYVYTYNYILILKPYQVKASLFLSELKLCVQGQSPEIPIEQQMRCNIISLMTSITLVPPNIQVLPLQTQKSK